MGIRIVSDYYDPLLSRLDDIEEALNPSEHQHSYTIPVEWTYEYNTEWHESNEGWGVDDTLPGASGKRVTKLLCPCGDIKDLQL